MKEKYFIVSDKISRWKLNNRVENWLGYKSDKSEFWKYMYVLYYRVFDSKYYKSGLSIANRIIERYLPFASIHSEVNRKALLLDMVYSLHRFGASYEDYFIYEFFNKNTACRESFDTLKLHYGYCDLVNGQSIRDLFEDKGACYNAFKPYYKRDMLIVKSPNDKTGFLDFMNRHESFIIKPYKGHSGNGIHIISKPNINEGFEKLFEKEIINGPFVLEEVVIQSKEMAALHPQSINTIRVVTFKTDENVDIIGAALRMGTGGAHIDNAGAGGIYSSIDVENGFVNSVARDNLGRKYSLHPDTNMRIPGFEIPKWEEAVQLVHEIALIVEDATMISWDLAYGNNGWLMIEGNDVGDPYLLQAPCQHGINSDIKQKIDAFLHKSRN